MRPREGPLRHCQRVPSQRRDDAGPLCCLLAFGLFLGGFGGEPRFFLLPQFASMRRGRFFGEMHLSPIFCVSQAP